MQSKKISGLLVVIFLIAGIGAFLFVQNKPPAPAPPVTFAPVAQEAPPVPAPVDITSCPALLDENSYTEKLDNYAFLIPGKDGWLFRTRADMHMDFDVDKVNLALWQKFSKLLKDRGIDLVVAYIPTRAMAAQDFLPENNPLTKDYDPAIARKNYTDLIAKMNESGVRFIGTPDIKSGAGYFNKADQHWKQAGAKEMAEAVGSSVHGLPSWASIPKMEFKTDFVQNASYEGRFNKALVPLCGLKTPDETDIETRTSPVASNEEALFGDTALPQVVLVGTSNSKKEDHDPNFGGYLKTALGADVLNDAITGGGFDDSIIAYLNSDDFKNSPPKILIWEVPGYYDVSGNVAEETLRQAMAGIDGACANPVATATQKLADQKMVILGDLAEKNIAMESVYVALKFDAIVKRDFSATFAGLEGKGETYKFKHPRSEMGSVFFYAPGGKKEKILQSVSLSVPDEMVGMTVEAQVCPLPVSTP